MYYTGGRLKLPLHLLVSREEGVAGAQQKRAGDRAGGRRTALAQNGEMLGKDDTIIHFNYNNCKKQASSHYWKSETAACETIHPDGL